MALTITKSPPQIIAVKQPVVFTLQTDYLLACRINGGISAIRDSIEPDTAHKATFELSDYVRDLPVLEAKLGQYVHANACPAQTFKFSERYGSPLSDLNEIETNTFRLLAAKVPHWKTDLSGTIDFMVTTTNPFLTWYPNRLDASPSIVLSWALANNPEKTVSKYSAKAINHVEGVNIESETRWFTINNLPYENPRQLIFRNSFGTFDQVMLRGIGSIIGSTDRITAYQQANYDADPVPERITWYNKGSRTLKTETAYMLRYESEWLNELINSTEIYQVSGSNLLPLECRTEKILDSDDDTALISNPLEFGYLQTPQIQ